MSTDYLVGVDDTAGTIQNPYSGLSPGASHRIVTPQHFSSRKVDPICRSSTHLAFYPAFAFNLAPASNPTLITRIQHFTFQLLQYQVWLTRHLHSALPLIVNAREPCSSRHLAPPTLYSTSLIDRQFDCVRAQPVSQTFVGPRCVVALAGEVFLSKITSHPSFIEYMPAHASLLLLLWVSNW